MTISEIFKRFLLLFIAGVLVYFSWIIYRDSREPEYFESQDPQLELSQYEIYRYNDQGTLEYFLKGDHLIHYTNEKGSELTNPILYRYQFTESEAEHLPLDWQAESLSATISQDKTLITLIDQVKLYKTDQQNSENDIILSTEELFIHDRGERISSDIFVKIEMPSRVISGIGAEGFPDKEQFTILQDVHSTLKPHEDSSND
ncbi:LPS export ABC transporter periplasmic protein LptC [Ignatzschineria sp. LJL83]